MNKFAIAAVAALLLAGCGHKEEVVYNGPDGGKMTVDKNSGSATFTNDKGTNISVGASVTEDQLGFPFYPSSAERPNASMVADEGGNHVVLSSRTTKDDPEKVVEFYKDKVTEPKTTNSNMGDTKICMMTGKTSDGGEVVMTANKTGTEDTKIDISVKHSGH